MAKTSHITKSPTDTKKAMLVKNAPLKTTLDGLAMFFSDLSGESKIESEMIEQNITIEFAKFIDDSINNPLKYTFEGFTSVGDAVANILDEGVVNFLKSQTDIVKKVVRPYKNGKLFYSIILKKDTTENRNRILSFIRKYERTPYQLYFPITFFFVPKEFEKDLIISQEVYVAKNNCY